MVKMKIGIDLVEHKDIEFRDDRFIKRVLSEEEYESYLKITNQKRRVEFLASRFAVKEAVFKCAEELVSPFDFRNITVCNNKNGAPYVLINHKDIGLRISLSHTDNYSIAVAILPTYDAD